MSSSEFNGPVFTGLLGAWLILRIDNIWSFKCSFLFGQWWKSWGYKESINITIDVSLFFQFLLKLLGYSRDTLKAGQEPL